MFELFLVVIVFMLAYLNGANDVSKGIATLVGSGAMGSRRAVLWGTLTTLAGALAGATMTSRLLDTFSSGMLSQPLQSIALPVAVTIGALSWVLFATRTGMPVSTTHALTGGIVGAGFSQLGASGILWPALLQKIALPLALSPIISFGAAWLVFPVIRRVLAGVNNYCLCLELQHVQTAPSFQIAGGVQSILPETQHSEITVIRDQIVACEQYASVSSVKLRVADSLHILTSGLTSFARGLNDTPKIAAMLLGASFFARDAMPGLFGFIALGMCAGSLLGGRKVLETLSTKITAMNGVEGFTANLGAASLLTAATFFGMPLSTTHVTTSAIVGIGVRARGRANWQIVREIGLAWLVTLPTAAVLAYIAHAVLRLLGL